MGPVIPLLAVWEVWCKKDASVEAIWVGTSVGPEKNVIESEGIPFLSIPTVRLRRYVSIEWIFIPVKFIAAFVSAMNIIWNHQPDIIASAGGYTAVPVIFAAKLLGKKIWVHQQDVNVTLTNRLTRPFANLLTVAWEKNRLDFGEQAQWVGNPVRLSCLQGNVQRAQALFNLDKLKPTVFIFGGGTGATWINRCVQEIVAELVKETNVIHLTGKGKIVQSVYSNYFVTDFLNDDMADAYAVADIVVCRAGLSSITELAALKKAAILIPLPHSPQEANAQIMKEACVILEQDVIQQTELLDEMRKLLHDSNRRKEFGEKMYAKLRTDGAEEIIEMLKKL